MSQSEIETCEAALNVAGAALTQPDASQHPTSCSHLLRLLLNVSEPILQAEDTLHTLNEVIMMIFVIFVLFLDIFYFFLT